MTLLGYLLGNITFIKDNIEILLVVVVFMSVIPIVIEVLAQAPQGARRGELPRRRDARYDEQAERDEVERKAFGA